MSLRLPLHQNMKIINEFSDQNRLVDILHMLNTKIANHKLMIHEIGFSEENRRIIGVVLGSGKKKLSLLAGSHSDEPVGFETCLSLLESISRDPGLYDAILEEYTIVLVPDINPDGRQKNEVWRNTWPDWKSYALNSFRELPGRDIEFGYPYLRAENEALAKFYDLIGPFDAHISLHGMGFSEGGLLLIDKAHVPSSEPLQNKFLNALAKKNLPLHDHNRYGEKGFQYVGPGISTTPESEPMRQFFIAQNDLSTAELFQKTSMEYVTGLGNAPLCVVTEIPLFLLVKPSEAHQPGVPHLYQKFRANLQEIKTRLTKNDPVEDLLDGIKIKPVNIKTAVEIHIEIITAVLESI